MKIDLSPAAEKALHSANIDSTINELDLIRLLSVLVSDEESLPAERLIAAGCRLDELKSNLETATPLKTFQRSLLSNARETATDHMEATITGEYLLVTMLKHFSELRTIVSESGARIEDLVQNHLAEVIITEEFESQTPPVAAHEVGADSLIKNVKVPLWPASDQLPILRLIDVNCNRVRESLRVLDDYVRFVRNDAGLTETIKSFRHDFVSILKEHNLLVNLQSRDTVHDVGTRISTAGEKSREDAVDVARTNAKRLQESLRSLEEFGKIIDPVAASKIEQLRYRSYTIERTLFATSAARKLLSDAKLYFLVTSSACRSGIERTVLDAIEGGVDIVQLREKSVEDRTLLSIARQLRHLTRKTSTLLIINDRPDIARLCEADGVHLGQEDLAIQDVRETLPPEMIIGASTHDPTQLSQAIRQGVDYVGVGPTFPSSTKAFDSFAGLDYVRHAMHHSPVPAFAIGGINLQTIGEVLKAGGKRVAVSAVISQSDDPKSVAKHLKAALTA